MRQVYQCPKKGLSPVGRAGDVIREKGLSLGLPFLSLDDAVPKPVPEVKKP